MFDIDYLICQWFRVAVFALAGAMVSLPGAAQSIDYADRVQEMYIAYYGRPGDPAGLDYWAAHLQRTGGNLGEIINAFGDSQEYNDRFGSFTNESLVDNIFQQMFGRSADPGGLAFYVGKLDSGALSLASIALDILYGAPQGTDDYTILANKLEVANAFTLRVRVTGASYDEYNIDAAKELLDRVDIKHKSVGLAIENIDDVLTDGQAVGGGCLEDALGGANSWSFAWNTSTETFAEPDSHSTSIDSGQFTVTLGAPQDVAGTSAYPLIVTGDPGEFTPRWSHVALSGDGSLLGLTSSGSPQVIYDFATASWSGGGFFAEFSDSNPVAVTSGTFTGEYNSVPANIVQTTSSSGGCERILDMTLCSDTETSFSEKEYFKECVGPVAYQLSIRYSDDGGGFFTSTTIGKTVELVATSFAAGDGTRFNAPSWTEVAPLSQARNSAAAVVLQGEIYVLGGYDGSSFLRSVEIYNPQTDSWRAGPEMPGSEVTSAAVVDGAIYASAGRDIYVYQPGSSSWTTRAREAGISFESSATYFDATFGSVIVGISGGSRVEPEWQIAAYQPSGDQWLEGASRYVGEWLRPSVEVVGDTLYAIGGYGSGGGSDRGILRKVTTYSFPEDEWTSSIVSDMNVGRDGHATAVLDGLIYACGGSAVASSRSAEYFDPETGVWTEIQPMFTARSDFAAVALNGSLYVLGEGTSVERHTPTTAH